MKAPNPRITGKSKDIAKGVFCTIIEIIKIVPKIISTIKS